MGISRTYKAIPEEKPLKFGTSFYSLSKPELFRKTAHAITLSDYLKILQGVMLVEPLERYSALGARKRSSIPCLLVRDNGLATSLAGRSFETTKDKNG